MNSKRAGVLCLCIASMLAAWACNASFSTARIKDATLSKEVTKDNTAVDPTNTFDAQVPVIHCLVTLGNAPEGTKVRAHWAIVNVTGHEPNEKVVDTDVSAGGSTNIVDFTLAPPPSGLPVGEYKVDVYLNPETGKEAPPTKTLTFSIK